MNKRHRSYCFTWNNYTVGNIDTLAQSFLNIGAKKYIYQEKIGEENNTPHLQGVVCFKNPVWFGTMKRIDSRIHWEACKDLKASIKYCSKPETRKKGTYPYKYNVAVAETWSSLLKTKIKTASESMAAMRDMMIADVQKKACDRSNEWRLQKVYEREWYEEMNKLFGSSEIIADMPDK